MLMKDTEIFSAEKNENFHSRKFRIFNVVVQNIDCGYMLELPCQGGSNKYPQSMFWIIKTKKLYTPVIPSFT